MVHSPSDNRYILLTDRADYYRSYKRIRNSTSSVSPDACIKNKYKDYFGCGRRNAVKTAAFVHNVLEIVRAAKKTGTPGFDHRYLYGRGA